MKKQATLMLECIRKFKRPAREWTYALDSRARRTTVEDERKRIIEIMRYHEEITKYHKPMALRKYSVKFFEELWGISPT